MGRTLADVTIEMIKLYGTKDNTYDDFPIGTHVKIICCCQDFHFFYGETGKVIRNKGTYLSIIVEFDKLRHFEGGYVQTKFNFVPKDLAIWNDNSKAISADENRWNKLSDEKKDAELEDRQRSKRFEILDL